MVDILRSKTAQVEKADYSKMKRAMDNMVRSVGSAVETAGKTVSAVEQRRIKEKQYQANIESNIENEQQNIKSQQQKAFDASDKLVAADMAGRLENDLLRWNLEQRQNNPNYIGTPDHEKAMRDYYARLYQKYSQGLGEVGRGEFTTKTQNTVNQLIGNDVKWAYQQKIKQGEDSARQIAESMNQTAAVYGANGDIQGFKESHSEKREQLADYSSDSMLPDNADKALLEADKKSVVSFVNGLSESNPKLAKALLENPELFKEIVPDEMIETANNIASKNEQKDLNEQLILTNAAIAGEKDKKEKRKLEKTKDKLEKQLKESQKKDYSEESVNAIYDDLRKSIMPQVQKQYELNQLAEKQAQEKAAVDIYTMALSPDKTVSNDARMSLRIQQPNNVDSEMHKVYKDYIKADQDVIKNTQPTLVGTVGAVELINNLVQPTNEPEIKQVEKALKTSTELHNSPVTQEQYELGNNIIYNTMADPEYKAQTQHTMALAKANILDHYAELFSPDVPETDKEFQKPMDTTPVASGVMVDFKTKKVVDFNYAAASEKNKAKYNLVKDTYAGVLNDISIGKFDDANEKIFALPYNVAKINYEGKLSPEVVSKFMKQDKTGGSPVEFMYNGYSFEYLGIDPTGTIKAKRRL